MRKFGVLAILPGLIPPAQLAPIPSGRRRPVNASAKPPTRPVTAKRLRSLRHRPADFRLGSLQATFEHRHTTCGEGEVVDFSGEGVALSVDAGSALYLSGDPIPRVRICRGDETFYDGAAVVRSIRDVAGKTILGLAFQNAFMDLGKVYHLDVRLDLEQRFGAFFEEVGKLGAIETRFKAWVADVQYFLDALAQRLRAEEERIRHFDLLTRESVARETVELVAGASAGLLLERLAELNEIVGVLDPAGHEAHRAYFKHHLQERFAASPILRRALQKPLGYAGDYEVMNMFYRDHREGESLFGRVLNVFTCKLSASQAVMNRVSYFAERLSSVVRARPGARIASVGCGPAQEIRELIRRTPEIDGCAVTLLDVEPLAIKFCERVIIPQINELGRNVRVSFIPESIRELIRAEQLEAVLDPQDVMISVGLFDYFGDKMFRHLLARLYELVRPGGQLIIGNFGDQNDSRVFMEYMTEWYLHHRSADELLALASVLPAEARVSVDSEPAGVNLFLHVEKPGPTSR